MKKYLNKVRQCIKGFTTTQFQQIAKVQNAEANTLAKTASANEIARDQIKVHYILSIDISEVNQIYEISNQTTPIMSYLKDELLPKDKEKARKLMGRAAKFVLIDEVLYKRGFSQPYLRCLTPNKSHYIQRDVHEEAYENHLGARSLVHKIVHAGYYWPSMQVDVKAYVKVCDKCQCYSNIPRQPSKYLTPMVAPWPFALQSWSFSYGNKTNEVLGSKD